MHQLTVPACSEYSDECSLVRLGFFQDCIKVLEEGDLSSRIANELIGILIRFSSSFQKQEVKKVCDDFIDMIKYCTFEGLAD